MDVRQFITDRLKEVLPSYDVRQGTNIYDFFVNLHYLLLLPFQEALEYTQSNMYLQNYSTMSEDAMDALASNFLVTRRTGSKSQGTVTLYFAEAQDALITVATRLTGPSSLLFYPIEAMSVSEQTMGTNYDSARGLYYISFQAESADAGVDYSIDANSITTIEYGPDNVYIIENTAFVGGADRETNADLYTRIQLALGLRDLVTKDSITTVLQEQFSTIDKVVVIGHGDDEMSRDIVDAIHVGNMIDVYVHPSTLTTTSSDVELTYEEYQTLIDGGASCYVMKYGQSASDAVPYTGQTDLSVPLIFTGQKYPTIWFERTPTTSTVPTLTGVPVIPPITCYLQQGAAWIELDVSPGYGEGGYGKIGYGLGEDWDAFLVCYDPSLRYSPDERVKLVFNPSRIPLYSTVRVVWDYADVVDTINDYANDDDVRVITCSTKVKHLVPIYVSVTITGTKGASYDGTALATAIEDLILDADGSAGLETSDLVQLCYTHGMTKVTLPITLSGYVFYPQGVIRLYTETDVLISDTDLTNFVGPRITAFKPGTIVVP